MKLNSIISVMFCIFFLTTCGGSSKSSNSATVPDIYVDQTSVDFGGSMLNNTVNKTLYIKNNGTSNLNIGQISVIGSTSPFSIDSSSDECSTKTLKPSETHSLTVLFKPQEQKSPITGTLSIPSNDPDSPTVNVALKGNGYGLDVRINQIDTSDCNNINIEVTVIDTDGAILNLDGDNLKLYQDGSPLATPCSITNYDEESVSAVLALDCSGSLFNDLGTIKTAAKTFIGKLGDNDEAAVCKFRSIHEFSPEDPIFFYPTTSGNRTLLDIYINSSFSADDGTALFNALFDSVGIAATHGTKTKKAVIVLSDGVNSVSGGHTQQDVITNSTSQGIPIYSIYYVTDFYSEGGKPEILEQLAENTGGQPYTGDTANLESLFQQISYVLTNKYIMTFSGCSAGSITIEVQATDPDPTGLSGTATATINIQ